ncbi:urease accessory protein UreE [Gabonibacter massiliensis]|uniref:urease accessory protein UreE n=1 Tax=Gabonibacter massiliensis TaxID=1720195 RepID=UPI00073EF61C|nr:urease accessory protein UreE [Gabonibacter massiliensis]
MQIFSEVIGNMISDPTWAEKLKNSAITYLDLDQWTAQKSRFIAKSDHAEYAVALKRHSQIENGDVLEYNPESNSAVVIRIDLKPVLVIELKKIAQKKPEEIIRKCIEIGHAIGNQHWPAIVKKDKLYVPLTVDKKVMTSVMDTHHFEDITYEFQPGKEVIPFLAPHEIRQLFGGSTQEIPHHHHEHGHTGHSHEVLH